MTKTFDELWGCNCNGESHNYNNHDRVGAYRPSFYTNKCENCNCKIRNAHHQCDYCNCNNGAQERNHKELRKQEFFDNLKSISISLENINGILNVFMNSAMECCQEEPTVEEPTVECCREASDKHENHMKDSNECCKDDSDEDSDTKSCCDNNETSC